MSTLIRGFFASLISVAMPAAFAADVTLPHQFSANTRAMAEEVNQNFSALERAVNDNNVRIQSLETSALEGVPYRCSLYVEDLDQNLPMRCISPNGDEFLNVPEDKYFYITDILISPRITPSTTVTASVRVWEPRGSISSEGCDDTGTSGSYLMSQNVTIMDATVQPYEHLSYVTPFLILRPHDCLVVYVQTQHGLIIDITGKLWNRLH